MISLGALEAGDGGIYWVANDTQTMYEQAVQQGDLETMLMLEHRATEHDGEPCNCNQLKEGYYEIPRRHRATRRKP